jgi:glutamate transport system substrate-binding protein
MLTTTVPQKLNWTKWASLGVAVCTSLVLSGCASAPAPSPEKPIADTTALPPVITVADGSTFDRVTKRGKVVIGVKFDVPLFGQKSPTGELVGFDIEIAEIIAGAIFGAGAGDPSKRIEFVEALSKDREAFLQQGTVDLVISTYTITDKRQELVDFAGPYYIAGQDILASSQDVASGAISGIGSLNGKKVCAVKGSTSLTNVKEAAPTADRYPECFAALKAGLVDAMTTDDVILLGLAQETPGEFLLTGNPFHTEPYGVGVPKGDTKMRTLVNEALASAYADGRWEAAFRSTIGKVGANVPTAPELLP